ncbi:MAG TPA: PH domain-containing protein [Pilimelia sp.]|nr:PH domain-containing protein [Pilimelia sp.]
MTGTDRARRMAAMTMARRAMTLARKAIRYELLMWRGLYRWTLRRPRASGPGAAAFPYAATLTPLLLAFIGVSAIEIPILHLILPWETARLVSGMLGLYGLFWMVGILACMRVYPHVVSDEGVRIRYGFTVDVTIPWDAIATVRTRNRPLPKNRTVQVERTDDGLVAHVVVLSQTNVDITLRRPAVVPLAKTGGEPVTELRCYADDPAALVARARERLKAELPNREQ